MAETGHLDHLDYMCILRSKRLKETDLSDWMRKLLEDRPFSPQESTVLLGCLLKKKKCWWWEGPEKVLLTPPTEVKVLLDSLNCKKVKVINPRAVAGSRITKGEFLFLSALLTLTTTPNIHTSVLQMSGDS